MATLVGFSYSKVSHETVMIEITSVVMKVNRSLEGQNITSL